MGRIIPAISESEPSLNAVEACEFLGGVTRQSLNTYVKSGRLPARKIGGRVFFLPSELRKFVTLAKVREKPQEAESRRRTSKVSDETMRELRRLGFKV